MQNAKCRMQKLFSVISSVFNSAFCILNSELQTSESSRLATVGVDDRALAEGRLRRREERDKTRDLLGLAESCDAERARHLLLGVVQRDAVFRRKRLEPRLQAVG